jgi:hypothetical protein
MLLEHRAFQLMGSTSASASVSISDTSVAAAVKLDEVTTRLFKWLAPTFRNRSSLEQLKILFATAFMKLALGKDAECFEVRYCISNHPGVYPVYRHCQGLLTML